MSKKYKYFLFLFLVVLGSGTGTPVVKMLVADGVDPYFVTFSRIILPLVYILFWMIFVTKEKPRLKDFRKHFWSLLAMGLIGVAGLWALMSIGLQHTEAGKSTLIHSFNPVIIVLLSHYFLKEALGWRRIVGIAAACVGLIFCITGSDLAYLRDFSLDPWDLAFLGTGTCFAVYTILIRKYGHYLSYIQTFFWILVASTIIFIPLIISRLDIISQLTFRQWAYLIYLGLVPGTICMLLWNKGVNIVGAAVSGIINSFFPVSAIILSAIWFGERLTWLQYLGAVLVICGIWQGIKKTAMPINNETGESLEPE